jgi:hypothetical protein
VPASGGSVTYSVVVTNTTTTEVLTLTSLSDDKFGDLKGQGDCAVPQPLAANGGTYTKKTSRRKSGACLSLGPNPRARFAA